MVGKAEELAEIDALFARADADHDGQINFSEFRALVRELEATDTPETSAHRLRGDRRRRQWPHQHR